MAIMVSNPDYKYLTWSNIGTLTWATSNHSDGSPLNWQSRTGNAIDLSISELVLVGDKMTFKGKDWELSVSEGVLLKENFDRIVDYNLKIPDKALFNDTRNFREINKGFKEKVVATDGILSNSRAVISDFVIGDVGISDSSVPVGYSKWKQFIPGQYTYQRALFKSKLMPMSVFASPILKDFIIYVDVEDILDRGFHSKVAVKGNTWIPFSKKFHAVPDVSFLMAATADGINTLSPEIKNITHEGFSVILLNKSGQQEAGEVTWLAIGY